MGVSYRYLSRRIIFRQPRRVSICVTIHQIFMLRAFIRTEEMRPQWFSTGDSNGTGTEPPIPYDKLWESDYLWFPLLLEKQKFIVRTDYVRDGDRDLLQKWCVKKKSSNAS